MSPLLGCRGIFVRECFCPGGRLPGETFSPGVFCPGALLPGGHFWPGELLAGVIFVRGAFVRGVFCPGAYARFPQVQCVYAPSRLSVPSVVA